MWVMKNHEFSFTYIQGNPFNFNHIDSFDNSLFISNSFKFPISVVSSVYIINVKYLLVSTISFM